MPRQPSRTVVQVTKIKLAFAKVHLIGTSPLIMHKFSEKDKKAILDAQTREVKGPKESRNPAEDAIEGTYWLEGEPNEYSKEAYEHAIANGARFGFPATGFRESACTGAYRNKLSKDKVSLYGYFKILGDEYVEIFGKPYIREDHVRIGINQTDLRFRSCFKNWETIFDIQYNRELATLDQILTYFEAGGFAVGVGDYRIENGGIFGGYRVSMDEVVVGNMNEDE